jgi:hypothetical protein
VSAAPPRALAVRVDRTSARYEPGERLEIFFELGLDPAIRPVERVEITVAWRTEGKGTEDVGVVAHERFDPTAATPAAAGETKRPCLTVTLPATPLSYDGFLVKVRWFVRARAFANDGDEWSDEAPFELGAVALWGKSTET